MKKRILCLLIVFVMLFSFLPSVCVISAEAVTQSSNSYEGTCGADLRWQFDKVTGVLTISGSGAMDSFDQAPWREYGYDVTEIVIQPGVTTISENAFRFCKATSVSIPETVTEIGEEAFSGCSHLTSLKLPASMTYLGKGAFSYCSSLKDISLPRNVTGLGTNVFSTCQDLKEVTIPSGWTEIPAGMFDFCDDLEELTISATVESIGAMAFNRCTSLSLIRFEGNAPDIEKNAFDAVKALVFYSATDSTWSADKKQDYSGDLTWYPEEGNGLQISGTFGDSDIMEWRVDGGTLYITGNGYMSGWNATERPPWYDYRGCIKKVVMSGTMQNIYSDAFANCTKLTEVVFPAGIIIIFDDAFSNCTSLKEIVIPNSVTSICETAFARCTELTSVTLPQSLKSVVGYAFANCSNLKSITFPAGVKSVGHGVFRECTSLETIYFTGNLPEFGDKAAYYCGTFGYLEDAVIYYPAGNSTWTESRLQKLSQDNPTLTFTPYGNAAPNPTEKPGVTTTPPATTVPAETTTPPATTVPAETTTPPTGTPPISDEPDTSAEQEPVQTPTESQNVPTESSAPTGQDSGTSESPDNRKGSTALVVAGVIALVAAIGVAGVIVLKKWNKAKQ